MNNFKSQAMSLWNTRTNSEPVSAVKGALGWESRGASSNHSSAPTDLVNLDKLLQAGVEFSCLFVSEMQSFTKCSLGLLTSKTKWVNPEVLKL